MGDFYRRGIGIGVKGVGHGKRRDSSQKEMQ